MPQSEDTQTVCIGECTNPTCITLAASNLQEVQTLKEQLQAVTARLRQYEATRVEL